jgi:hypothetical protein
MQAATIRRRETDPRNPVAESDLEVDIFASLLVEWSWNRTN